MTIEQKAREIADELTPSQARVLARTVGLYTDDEDDVLYFLNIGVWEINIAPLGEQVRALIEEQKL